jgi:AhpD family alkylhydroperoxidase
MTPLQHVEWEDCIVEPTRDRELEGSVKAALGYVPEYVAYVSACPWVVRSFLVCDPASVGLVHTSFDLAERVALVVSQDNSCRYCYAAHRAYLSILGLGEDRIQRLEHDFLSGRLSPGEKLPLEFVRRVSRLDPPPSHGEWSALLQAGYTEGAVKELTFLAASNVYANRISTLPALPYQSIEGLERRWVVRLLRPLIARRFLAKRRRGTVEALAPALRAGPFSKSVLALDGLPVARALRTVIDDAWSSGILSRRAKALVFAVVARALGCPGTEAEATRLLAAEGLDRGQVESILAHLGSPMLDPIEALIVPYARETVRYDPARIQRRGRTLRGGLSNAQFLDVVGTAALANAVARLDLCLSDHA